MKPNRENNKTVGKDRQKKRKNPLLFVLLLIIGTLIFMSNKNDVYINKKLILNEPTKITLKNEFIKLVESNRVETVYMNDKISNILFTVKEGTKVNQVDYKTNEGKVLKKLEEQSEKYKNSKTKKDKAIFVYKSFNPNNENFKDYLLSKDIQVLSLPNPEDKNLVDKLVTSFLTIMMYVILFKIFLFPSNGESNTKESIVPTVKFSDIAGNKEAKEEMQFLVDFLKEPDSVNKLGATMPKGVLFYGPPGTGKTMLAKAIAGEAGVPFFSRSGTDFIDKYVGVGSQRVRSLFKTASKHAPCIVFIDEIDSIGSARGSDLKEFDNTLNQLLVELDGFKSNEGVVVIAATNRIDTLDSGLIRPGRFDRHIAINLPDKKDRELLLDVYLKDKPLDEDVDIKNLAALTYNFSGAGIKSFVNDAALIATQRRSDFISKSDFDDAFVKSAFGAFPKRVHEGDEDKIKLLAYHEAGHALVTKLFTNDKVHKVTIVGTTGGTGGFTSITPEKETMSSKDDLFNRIRINYGGRIGEYLLYDKDDSKITTGASGDLRSISDLLDYIIREVGMYDDMLFKLSESEYSNSEVLKYKKELSKKLYNETLASLEANIDILHAISDALFEKETLNDEELNEIISSHEVVYIENMNKKYA